MTDCTYYKDTNCINSLMMKHLQNKQTNTTKCQCIFYEKENEEAHI